jgi:hypothetical protein
MNLLRNDCSLAASTTGRLNGNQADKRKRQMRTQIQINAQDAKADQLDEMRNAKSALEAYWAGSATASVLHHYRRGAVKTIRVNEYQQYRHG